MADTTSPFDTADPVQRQAVVDEVRRRMDAAYPEGWRDRCPEVAARTGAALWARGVRGHRIAAGRVEETTGNPPAVLFKGEYTGTGTSEYHTWVVASDGSIIDLSVVPQKYGKDYFWEPHEGLPLLRYTEKEDVMRAVLGGLAKKYVPGESQPASGSTTQ